MDEGSLARLGEGLRERLGREKNMADAVREEIGRREEEVDWGMRIVVGDEGTEGDGEGGGDGEDDLFGEDEDEEMGGEGKKVGDQAKGQGEGEGLWNPREGWTVVDYVRFMESGKQPEPARPEPEAPRTDPWPDLSSSITD
jgi:hypothetical protein